MSFVKTNDSSLKEQFKFLQEQQMRKKQRRKELKESNNLNKVDQSNQTGKQSSFGIDDDLNLLLDEEGDENKDNYLSAELVDHLNSEIRELKDETGRLRKLLNEREFELKQARKKKEAEKDLPIGVTNENAASKIVELSKKVREMTAELEAEKNRTRLLTKKCQDFELLSLKKDSDQNCGTLLNSAKTYDKDELKATQDKLKQAEMKLSEQRNNNLMLKHEIKIAQKIIGQEVGDGVTIQSLTSVPGNWKGRSEQILALNNKVADLKTQLDFHQSTDTDSDISGSRLSRQHASDKQRDQLRRLEKERKEAHQKSVDEYKELMENSLSQKQKFEAAKARNKVLSVEMKSLKQQMQTLIEKGQNDDELISALMKQQCSLRDMLNETQQTQEATNTVTSRKVMELSAQKQQDDAVVAQLREIIHEKEEKLCKLEHDIQQIQINKLQEAQQEGLKAIFHLNNKQAVVSDASCENTSGSASAMAPARGVHEECVGDRLESSRRRSRPGSSRPTSTRTTPRKAPSPSIHRQASALERKEAVESIDMIHYRTICKAAEVERDKLSELVTVLQNRLEECSNSVLESQNEAIHIRRRNALLEKKINQFNLEQNGKRTNNSRALNTARSIDCDADELNTALAIQQDENTALKAALTSAMRAKEQDLRVYKEMMETTRLVFLQALQPPVE